MYCNKCAVKVNEEDMFCFYCGTRLKEEKVVSSRVEEVSKTNKNVCYDVFAIVGLIMGILGIVLAMFSAYVTETLTFAGNELIVSIGGIIFGAEFVGGLLVGATICAIPRAIFMGNSGGAFDNAKKYIESDSLEGHGKGSAAHKAAVTGDTIGDTRKDVVGVALDIFIKMMSTVANTFVSLFSHFSLF